MRYTISKKTREVPVTINGETRMVPEDYDERTPKMPRSADRTVRNAMMSATAIILTAAIVWSTVAIGSLLSMVAPAWAAYMIAAVFDGSWILCLAAEWLSRYDTDRAKLPRTAGWVFLVVSMALIAVHGMYEGAFIAGVSGALVSAVAKFVWKVTMGSISIKLDPKYAAFLRIKEQEAGSRLAFAVREAEIARMEARAAELRTALAVQTGETLSVSRETPSQALETADSQTPSQGDTSPVKGVETLSHPVMVASHGRETLPEGVETLLSHLRTGETLTATRAAELLGVSRATGGRRLAEAKAAHAAALKSQTGLYL